VKDSDVRKCFVLFSLIGAHVQALTQTDWFTVLGNPGDASIDMVQVDPTTIKTTGDLKTMNVRASRSQPRLNWDKVPYRSYESRVVFDCKAMKADYMFVAYYMTPLWQGMPYKTVDYAGDPRPMRFRDVEPNPTERIVRAACRSNVD
jgi:hypothetical protein